MRLLYICVAFLVATQLVLAASSIGSSDEASSPSSASATEDQINAGIEPAILRENENLLLVPVISAFAICLLAIIAMILSSLLHGQYFFYA